MFDYLYQKKFKLALKKKILQETAEMKIHQKIVGETDEKREKQHHQVG